MALSYVCDRDLGTLLRWCHSCLMLLYCNLYVSNNCQLISSTDMKLRVLIKEALVVFNWVTFRIILLYSLTSVHWTLFLIQETIQELLYLLLSAEHCTQIHEQKRETVILLLMEDHIYTFRKKLQITSNWKNTSSD